MWVKKIRSGEVRVWDAGIRMSFFLFQELIVADRTAGCVDNACTAASSRGNFAGAWYIYSLSFFA